REGGACRDGRARGADGGARGVASADKPIGDKVPASSLRAGAPSMCSNRVRAPASPAQSGFLGGGSEGAVEAPFDHPAPASPAQPGSRGEASEGGRSPPPSIHFGPQGPIFCSLHASLTPSILPMTFWKTRPSFMTASDRYSFMTMSRVTGSIEMGPRGLLNFHPLRASSALSTSIFPLSVWTT